MSADKAVLITGASSGLGEALALEIASPATRLALVARRRERLEVVARRVTERGGEPTVLVCDVGDRLAVKEAASRLRQEMGSVDLAILNAGLGSANIAQNLDAGEAEQVMRVNYFGVVNWLEHLLPDMQKRNRGTIAVTSSLAAYRGLPGCGTYCAAKAAVSTLVESCQIDLLATNIRLMVVSPYFVETEMTGFDPGRNPRVWTSAPEAARRVVRAIDSGRREVVFPWHFRWFMIGLRVLPPPLYRAFWRMARRGG